MPNRIRKRTNAPPTPATPFHRRAHHAGSWYDSSPSKLNQQLSEFLEAADAERDTTGAGGSDGGSSSVPSSPMGTPRGIIAPHAGYSYSGPAAAYAYLALQDALSASYTTDATENENDNDNDNTSPPTQTQIRTIVVLHPSHHVHLDGCEISSAAAIETPLGNIPVDDRLRRTLLSTGEFGSMPRSVDEEEHSGEMQYPYIAKLLSDRLESSPAIQILPIMVGSTSTHRETHFGTLLAPILARSEIFTVISSDFCHWGSRFGFAPQGVFADKEIFKYIEGMDRLGMDRIQMQQPGAFAEYLRETNNTICGRHPIGVWLNAVKSNKDANNETLNIKFVHYAQSSRVTSRRDSSVSYASAIATQVSD